MPKRKNKITKLGSAGEEIKCGDLVFVDREGVLRKCKEQPLLKNNKPLL